jgi:hypothetical protein
VDELTVRDRAHFAALSDTYKAWRITVQGGIWWASLVRPITDAERVAGVVQQFARRDPVDLAVALAQQYGKLRSLGFVLCAGAEDGVGPAHRD